MTETVTKLYKLGIYEKSRKYSEPETEWPSTEQDSKMFFVAAFHSSDVKGSPPSSKGMQYLLIDKPAKKGLGKAVLELVECMA